MVRSTGMPPLIGPQSRSATWKRSLTASHGVAEEQTHTHTSKHATGNHQHVKITALRICIHVYLSLLGSLTAWR